MKKKNMIPVLIALALGAALAGCSQNTAATDAAAGTAAAATMTETAAETATAETTDLKDKAAGSEAKTGAASDESGTDAGESAKPAASDVAVRVGSLKGPTSMGLVDLMDRAAKGETDYQFDFTMVTAADELLGKMVSGDLDIALVPANVASVLYNKTQGQVAVIDINTLGVLDIVASDDSIKSIADLKGKTLSLTGKGTTPDYVIRYLLAANGLTEGDVTLEYKSEPTEVAAMLKEQPDTIGLLPQPFVTAAMAQNENLKLVLDLTKEWQKVQGESQSQLVTGVTVVRRAFLEEQEPAIAYFLDEHKVSAAFTAEQPDQAAELIAAAGIIEKAPVAKKALPFCNIVSISGGEMKDALSGYLQVLFDQDPKSVGGKLPGDDFYYLP